MTFILQLYSYRYFLKKTLVYIVFVHNNARFICFLKKNSYLRIAVSVNLWQTYFDESVLAFIPLRNLENFIGQGEQSHSSPCIGI